MYRSYIPQTKSGKWSGIYLNCQSRRESKLLLVPLCTDEEDVIVTRRMETIKVSRLPTTMFVTVQLLEDNQGYYICTTPAKKIVYVCVWTGCQLKNSVKNHEIIPRFCDNFVPVVVPGLSSEPHLTSSVE